MFAFYIHRSSLFTLDSWLGLSLMVVGFCLLLLVTPSMVASLKQVNWRKWAVALSVVGLLSITVVGAVEYVVLPAPCHQLPWYIWILFPECW